MKTLLTLFLFLFSICSAFSQWISANVPGARLVASNSEWLYASHHTVVRSNNGGGNWEGNLSGLPQATTNRVVCLVATDSVLFAGFGSAGFYYSKNNGAQWSMVAGLPPGSVRSMVKIGTTWYAAIEQAGIYKTSDPSFSSWESMNAGLPVNTPGKNFVSLTAQYSSLFVCVTGAGIYYFDVESMVGSNWFLSSQNVSSGPPLDQPTSLAFVPERQIPSGFSGPFVYAGTANNGVYDSGDAGALWDPANPVNVFKRVYTLFSFNNALLAATDSGTYVNLLYNVWEKIPGVTGRSFTVQNGFLYFADSVNIFSGPLPAQLTANKTLLALQKPSIFPNPGRFQTFVRLPEGLVPNSELTLKDAVGKEVLRLSLSSFIGETVLDLPISTLSSGIYTLQIQGPGSKLQPVKLSVQR